MAPEKTQKFCVLQKLGIYFFPHLYQLNWTKSSSLNGTKTFQGKAASGISSVYVCVSPRLPTRDQPPEHFLLWDCFLLTFNHGSISLPLGWPSFKTHSSTYFVLSLEKEVCLFPSRRKLPLKYFHVARSHDIPSGTGCSGLTSKYAAPLIELLMVHLGSA